MVFGRHTLTVPTIPTSRRHLAPYHSNGQQSWPQEHYILLTRSGLMVLGISAAAASVEDHDAHG